MIKTKLLLLLALSLSLPLTVQAQTAQIPPSSNNPITDALSNLTLNNGIMYGIKANSVQYTMTANLVKGKGILKGFSIIGGYSTAAKAIAGVDYDLMNLTSVDIPLLKYVDVHIGYAVSWDNITGRNVIDHGPVFTIAQITF